MNVHRESINLGPINNNICNNAPIDRRTLSRDVDGGAFGVNYRDEWRVLHVGMSDARCSISCLDYIKARTLFAFMTYNTHTRQRRELSQ